MPNIFMLSVVMLNVVMLNVVLLNVVILSVVTPFDCQILPIWSTFQALLTWVGSGACTVKHYGFIIYRKGTVFVVS
jgi:hypothetical protein